VDAQRKDRSFNHHHPGGPRGERRGLTGTAGHIDPSDTPDQSASDTERHFTVLHHAAVLPPTQSRCVILKMDGATHQEAASTMGISYAAYQRSLLKGQHKITSMIARRERMVRDTSASS
jgi:DNA-directed RNA polymerase specialized sigma24 family protein